jgi:hypothetical protein
MARTDDSRHGIPYRAFENTLIKACQPGVTFGKPRSGFANVRGISRRPRRSPLFITRHITLPVIGLGSSAHPDRMLLHSLANAKPLVVEYAIQRLVV